MLGSGLVVEAVAVVEREKWNKTRRKDERERWKGKWGKRGKEKKKNRESFEVIF